MRPLFHPAIEDITVEAVLHALGDPVRMAICVELSAPECRANCSAFQQVLNQPVPKSTLSLHFRILREAGLIRGERRGVDMFNVSRSGEIDARFPGLLTSIVNAYQVQIAGRETQSRKKRVGDKRRTQR